jgi:hypothetical protein
MRIKKKYVIYSLILLAVFLTSLLIERRIDTYNKKEREVKNIKMPTTPTKPPQLSADEKLVLAPLKKDATKEEIQNYGDALNRIAIETDKIALDECRVSPTVIKVKSGTELSLTNLGEKEATFFITSNSEIKSYTLKPKANEVFIPTFDEYSVTYRILCTKSDNTIGIIYVTE